LEYFQGCDGAPVKKDYPRIAPITQIMKNKTPAMLRQKAKRLNVTDS